MDIAPAVLQDAAADPASSAWAVIWEESCHQGTCDPASAALLPWLAATIAGFTDDGRETPLALAGFIALDATDADRIGNLSEIAALRAMAVARLPRASSDSAFVYLLQAILGFDGDETWGKELDHLNDGEVEVRCPDCGEETLVDLLDDDSGLVAGLSGELAERLHGEAVRAGRESVATALTRLFGRIDCPHCGAAFNVADHLAGISDA